MHGCAETGMFPTCAFEFGRLDARAAGGIFFPIGRDAVYLVGCFTFPRVSFPGVCSSCVGGFPEGLKLAIAQEHPS